MVGRAGTLAASLAVVFALVVVDGRSTPVAVDDPLSYGEVVLADEPVAYWRLGETAGVTAGDEIDSLDGEYVGAPDLTRQGLVGGDDTAIGLDGVDDMVAVPDSHLINLGVHSQRSIEAWFEVTEADTRQVIVEEGGGSRGLSIYIDQGSVYVGGWNLAEDDRVDTPWGESFVSTPMTAATPHHVVLVYDHEVGTIEGYLDGGSFGVVDGVGTLLPHTSDTGLGALNGSGRFHDGKAVGGFNLAGTLDEVAFYTAALTPAQVQAHYIAGTDVNEAPTIEFANPSHGEVVAGIVSIELAATDDEDEPGELIVEVSTDGGASYRAAKAGAASSFYVAEWDTVGVADGTYTLVSRVTDSGGLVASVAIDVVVSNPQPSATYADAALATHPTAYWTLDESIGTLAADAVSGLDGLYSGGPGLGAEPLVTGGVSAVHFDGTDDAIRLADSQLINTGTNLRRTVSLWFRADSVIERQLLFDDGGATRGLSIYIDDGQIYAGAWNRSNDSSDDTPWGPWFVSGSVTAGETYNVAIVLDQPAGTIAAYLNGAELGAGSAGTLHGHSADAGIGAANGSTRFHDGALNGDLNFGGIIDDVTLHNSALAPDTVGELYRVGAGQSQLPLVRITAPATGAFLSAPAVIEVMAGDLQDSSGALNVEVSSDGGVSFAAATFNPVTELFELEWEPSQVGPATLVARATDRAGNRAVASLGVSVTDGAETAILVAAGDIASCGSGGDESTAALIGRIVEESVHPVTLVPLGDLAYNEGSPSEFAECYQPSWGVFNDLAKPIVGNHEYRTPGASGYYDYWGDVAAAPDGYYSYTLGGWQVMALNSACSRIGGCGSSSGQVQWLRAELAAADNACTIAFFHHPRFVTDKPEGSSSHFWRALHEFGAEVVVNGHEHYFAMSAAQDRQGNLDPESGIRQFIVGTGGKSFDAMPEEVHPNQEIVDATEFGVLVMALSESGYSWQFRRIGDGAVMHSGVESCH